MPDVSVTAPLKPITVSGEGLRLRPWAIGDLPCVADAATDSFIPTITTVPATFDTESGTAFVMRQHGRLTSGEGWALAIADETSDEALGHIGLWLAQAHKGRAEIGYWVRPSARGRGVAGRALTALSDWAFGHLALHRLSLFIEPWKEASQRTATAAGYEREALLRRWELVAGEPRDMWSFARLRAD